MQNGEATLAWILFWIFAVIVFAQSILYAWVYNNTGRSILSAILLHFMHNSTQNLLAPMSDRTFLLSAMLLVLGAILVVVIWGPKTFTRRRE